MTSTWLFLQVVNKKMTEKNRRTLFIENLSNEINAFDNRDEDFSGVITRGGDQEGRLFDCGRINSSTIDSLLHPPMLFAFSSSLLCSPNR